MNSLRYELPGGGNVYVARLHTNDEGFAEELAERAGEIGAEAWGGTDWMRDIAGGDSRLAQRLSRDLFRDPERQAKRVETILDDSAALLGRRSIYGAFSGAAIAPERMIGYASVEPDVSGTPTMIRLKKAIDLVAPGIPFRSSPVFTKVEALNVDPREQRSGIGVATFATAIMDTRFWRHITSYTEEHNTAMRGLFEACDLRQTGDSEVKTHYFGKKHPTDQVRYESQQDRVGTVLMIQQQFPWLRTPTKIS